MRVEFVHHETKELLWWDEMSPEQLPRNHEQIRLTETGVLFEVWDVERLFTYARVARWGGQARHSGARIYVRRM